MSFWKRHKKGSAGKPAPVVVSRRSGTGHRFPMEVKLLAARAKEAGVGAREVAELIGASSISVSKWHKLYREGGSEALMLQSSSPGTQRICRKLERRIELYRGYHPEAGVRKIRDSLRREEGLSVSAETVRRVVNEAGVGNAPVILKRRGRQDRRQAGQACSVLLVNLG